jgi:hypothetical protein
LAERRPVPEIETIRQPVSLGQITAIAESTFGSLVKAVVDVKHGIMAVGGELHSDDEALLLDAGSQQHDLWGINLYPAEYGRPDWVEFDSMINVRPRQGNRSRYVEDRDLRQQIVEIIDRLVQP